MPAKDPNAYALEWRRKHLEKVRAYDRERNKKRRGMSVEEWREACRKKSNAWNEANPGRATENARKWRAANPEKVKEISRKQREVHGEKIRAATQRWREENPERYKETCRKSKYKKYGITPEQYDQMLEAQNGRCKMCGDPPNGQRLHIDHCHETGVIRGILCSRCNTALGLLKHQDERIDAAKRYLAR